MNPSGLRTLLASLGIALILAGESYGVGASPADTLGRKRVISEDSLGFGDEDRLRPIGGGASQGPGKRIDPAIPVTSEGTSRQAQPAELVPRSVEFAPPSAEVPRGDGPVQQGNAGASSGAKEERASKLEPLQMQRDELFKQVFKKAPPPRMREIVVRLFMDNAELEQAKIVWDPQFGDFQFLSPLLARRLDSMIAPASRIGLHGEAGLFTRSALRDHRFGVELDEAEFTLRIAIPPEHKVVQTLEFQPHSSSYSFGEEIRPAKVSAYLNTSWTQNWYYFERFFASDTARQVWEKYNGAPSPTREPLSVDLDGAVRALDWVVLGEGSVREPATGDWGGEAFIRKNTRLVRDFPSINSRLSVGDVSISHEVGDFAVPQVGGFDAVFGNALLGNPTDQGTDVGFFLHRPADVAVVLNDAVVRTMKLGSGSHRITGIVGRPGMNAGEIRIAYPDGTSQSIPFRFNQAFAQVLPAGTRNWSLGGGLLRLSENRYGSDLDKAVAMGSFTQGFGPTWNGKCALGLQRDLQIGHAGLLWVQDSSTIWEMASTVSRDDSGRIGQRWGVRLTQLIQPVSVSVTGSFTQADFKNTFFAPSMRQTVSYAAGLSVGRSLWKGTLNLNSDIQFKRDHDSTGTPIDYSLGLSYNLDIWNGFRVNALGNCVIHSGEITPYASLVMSYFFNMGRHSVYALNQIYNQKTYVAPSINRVSKLDTTLLGMDKIVRNSDSAYTVPGNYRNEWTGIANGGWSWSEGMGLMGGKALSANVNYSPNQYGARIGAQRTLNHGEFSASYSLSDQNQLGLMSRSHYLSARGSFSLQFADGVFGVGRRVQDGFLLVSGKNDLASTDFQINPSEQYNTAYSQGGSLLAGTYGLLSPYRVENFQIKPVDPPVGTFLDGDQYFARNTYKQGFVLRLGKPPRVFVRFRLLDESDQPLSYTTFRIFKAADSAKVLYQSFSSKEGMVQIGDLEPGQKYVLRFGEDAFIKPHEFTIPKGSPSMLNLGDIHVEHESFYALSRLTLSAVQDTARKTRTAAALPDPSLPAPVPAPAVSSPPVVAPEPTGKLLN